MLSLSQVEYITYRFLKEDPGINKKIRKNALFLFITCVSNRTQRSCRKLLNNLRILCLPIECNLSIVSYFRTFLLKCLRVKSYTHTYTVLPLRYQSYHIDYRGYKQSMLIDWLILLGFTYFDDRERDNDRKVIFIFRCFIGSLVTFLPMIQTR
jgi:hypothetical protein